jgi:phosphatidylserine decarboxylase
MGLDADYLNQFEPDTVYSDYNSYHDFFRRRYKQSPLLQGNYVWPCEGYICDWGQLIDKSTTSVKGQSLTPSRMFSTTNELSADYYFVNIFLHNHNYHRVHAPVNAIVTNVETIPGDLVFLRPWFYSQEKVSVPAFRNERVCIELQDAQLKKWYLLMVGGFGVGTIQLAERFKVGTYFHQGEELGMFQLGSTVCMATPVALNISRYLHEVEVGQALPVVESSRADISPSSFPEKNQSGFLMKSSTQNEACS